MSVRAVYNDFNVVKVIYTRHVEDKFIQEKYVFQLGITKHHIKQTLLNPVKQDNTRGEKITAIGHIDEDHELVVIYRKEKPDKRIIITFFPAKKDRYAAKLLP
ncbi:MAG TPA: hypothetical protein VJL83_00340 [Patescibacteria group bacterium]|nr:hypothetical protein [Patescibacteria group bacterium]